MCVFDFFLLLFSFSCFFVSFFHSSSSVTSVRLVQNLLSLTVFFFLSERLVRGWFSPDPVRLLGYGGVFWPDPVRLLGYVFFNFMPDPVRLLGYGFFFFFFCQTLSDG